MKNAIETNQFLGREVHRGEIFYMHKPESIGSEMHTPATGRPVIIVSNEKANEVAPVVTVVCVTSRDKTPLPTHVEIPEDGSIPIHGTILCETVQQCSKLRLGDYVGEVSDELMKNIEERICIQCGITSRPTTKLANISAPAILAEGKKAQEELEKLRSEFTKLQLDLIRSQERENVFRELYNQLLTK